MLQEPLNNLEEDMTPDKVNKSVTEHLSEIERLNRLVVDLQKDCRHIECDVKNVGTAPIDLKNVCRTCHKELGYPSKDELKEAGY